MLGHNVSDDWTFPDVEIIVFAAMLGFSACGRAV